MTEETIAPEERILDWAPHHDPRSREYPIRALITARPRPRNMQWRVGPILDQLAEGACVGFAWTAEALATPVIVDLSRAPLAPSRDPDAFARLVYRRAQDLDPWAGNQYEGTSVNAGALAMRELGLVKEWRWAFGIEDVQDTVLMKGPVVLGLNWYSGMYRAAGGILTRSGSLVGGHSLLAVGYRTFVPALGEPGIILQNSWGKAWGINGLAVIGKSKLAALLAENGEAAVPTRRSYGRTP